MGEPGPSPDARARRVWLLVLLVSTGTALGVGLYTFEYAEGLSYFSTDPAACVNCHIMQPQYDAWLKSSHRRAATCVDCHLPHTFFAKYLAKAENGYRHSKEFTAQTFHEPIMIRERGSEILQANCVDCHEAVAHALVTERGEQDAPRCVHCHFGVGHGERAGLGGPLRYGAEQSAALPLPGAEPD